MAVLKAYQVPNLLEFGALIIEEPANDDGINVANNLITNLGSRSGMPDVGPYIDEFGTEAGYRTCLKVTHS